MPYSHRSIVLHAMAAGLSSAFGFGAFDVILPCSSMYHATAWGLPYAAGINGCKLVLPCDRMDGPSLARLICDEGVTFSCGVPTIWTMYLAHIASSGQDVSARRSMSRSQCLRVILTCRRTSCRTGSAARKSREVRLCGYCRSSSAMGSMRWRNSLSCLFRLAIQGARQSQKRSHQWRHAPCKIKFLAVMVSRKSGPASWRPSRF